MRPLAIAALVLLAAGCAKDLFTPLADIPKLTKLDEVMDNQKAAADPLFARAGQASFGDEDFAAFAKAAERLQVTSAKVKEFSKAYPKGPGEFEALSTRIGEGAKALGAAAAAKDAAAAKAALTGMKATCRECHSKFR